MPHKRNIVLLIFIVSLLLACTSISQFVGMPDPNDPGLNPKELEDDSISADATLRAEYAATDTAEALQSSSDITPQDTDGLDLTPEEKINSGQHFYLIDGTGTPLLGGSGTHSGEGYATSDFVDGGVYFNLSEQAPAFYTRTGPNTYINENSTITLTYTSAGFNMHLEDPVWDYAYTLKD